MVADWRRSPRYVHEMQGTLRLRLWSKAALASVSINKKLLCESKTKTFLAFDFARPPAGGTWVKLRQLVQSEERKRGEGETLFHVVKKIWHNF